MTKLVRMLAVLVALLAGLTNAGAVEDKANVKDLEAIIDAAMKAYNEADWKAFFKDYSKDMAAIASEPTFKALYGPNAAMGQFGKFVKRLELIKDQSVLEGENVLAHWHAEFAKNKKVKISVNFVKEDGKYRIQQITLGSS
ncbi:MAG TPA: hypothetical protein PKD86_15205 [Gemmatales bacterium]|nr:hypothetical protein [Gemmatales bacterium]HMP60691.1 hypothetical protein [Gemmatales bacterium]